MKQTSLLLLFILTVLGCKKTDTPNVNEFKMADSSYTISECARCGRGGHVETKSGKTVRNDVTENDLSKWLSDYRTGTCEHIWLPIAGGITNQTQNVHWDDASPLPFCLHYIKDLNPSIGESETKLLLAKYYSILDIKDDQKKETKLNIFNKELESKLYGSTKFK